MAQLVQVLDHLGEEVDEERQEGVEGRPVARGQIRTALAAAAAASRGGGGGAAAAARALAAVPRGGGGGAAAAARAMAAVPRGGGDEAGRISLENGGQLRLVVAAEADAEDGAELREDMELRPQRLGHEDGEDVAPGQQGGQREQGRKQSLVLRRKGVKGG